VLSLLETRGDSLWAPIRELWKQDTPATRNATAGFLTRDTTVFQYSEGVPKERVNPDAIDSDQAVLDRPGNKEIQLDLFADYASNLKLYPAFHEAFRRHQHPMLIVWGKNDPIFTAAGADAFLRDLPKAEVHMLDTGHFALETHAAEIAAYIRGFLPRALAASASVKR
jgi:pimeloyl-ACP methyl ester carboxylesterase